MVMIDGTPRNRLTRDDWAEAAVLALAEGGVGAIAVAPLARRLGVTKGSFYWHFANRAELVDAALDYWARRATHDVIARLERRSVEARLAALLAEALDPEHVHIEAALLAAATLGESQVAQVYTRVSEARLAYVVALYAERGVPEPEVRGRALYAAFLGSLQLTRVHPMDDATLLAHIDELVARFAG
jgi:AcrR family transcriptional regulator